ncbi:phytanoyl-CoA dioxygenase family protein [Paenibacillus montanisoli]|uniref:phytanoyl-CoA dioxygenase family protein n=1 Tax=Paenibacillus montanisoli TaxID=2081970 RepID=UPI0019804DFC|nr:phytanoyl-CoA dioxygenase family protein [Paenibacillus montanisoli]
MTYVEQFEKDGYVVIPDVLDAELMAEFRSHVEWLARKYPNRRETLDHTLVQFDPFWLRLVADPRLLDIAEQFIGPDIALFASSYFNKKAFEGEAVLWHQDGVYWPLEPMNVVTLWLAVDDSTPENGCLRVIPGSHKLDLKEYFVNKEVPNALESQIDLKHVDESQAVDLILKAGSVSIHHPNIIHGSNANLSPHRRCGLTIRYIPTSTRISIQPWPCQFLLRGKPIQGINEYMPFPKYAEGASIQFRGMEAWK